MELIREKVILGIDPGTATTGYGIIRIEGKKISLVQMGVIHLDKYPDHAVKLEKIFGRVVQLISEYLPDEMAIEAPFFGKNVQSMLKLGRAQGVAIAAAISRQVPVVEYSPKKVKQSVTGNGNADKTQVAAMLHRIMANGLPTEEMLLDATDALAVAVCHYYQSNNPLKGAKSGSWADFAKQNAHRIK